MQVQYLLSSPHLGYSARMERPVPHMHARQGLTTIDAFRHNSVPDACACTVLCLLGNAWYDHGVGSPHETKTRPHEKEALWPYTNTAVTLPRVGMKRLTRNIRPAHPPRTQVSIDAWGATAKSYLRQANPCRLKRTTRTRRSRERSVGN